MWNRCTIAPGETHHCDDLVDAAIDPKHGFHELQGVDGDPCCARAEYNISF